MNLHNIGKLYVLDYPFTDASHLKRRPTAIVIEEDEDFEVLYITTKPGLDTVEISESDFVDGWLPETSYIKISKSIPFDKSLFTQDNYLWTLSLDKIEQVFAKIVAKYQIILQQVRALRK